MKITWDEVQANRRDARFRRLNLMGHGCVVFLAVLSVIVMATGCGKKQEQSYSVQAAPVSAPVGKLGGL